MGTTKSRKSRRNNSRPTAFSFLSNIALGNENDKPPDEALRSGFSNYNNNQESLHFIEEQPQAGASSFHSTDSSFSAEEDNIQSTLHSESYRATNSNTSPPVITFTERGKNLIPLESSTEDIEHHTLTREDSEKPIASEKIKRRSNHTEKDQNHGGLSFMSVFRYYTSKLRTSRGTSENRGYVQLQLENNDNNQKHKKAESYARFLHPITDATSLYDPFFLDDDSYDTTKKSTEFRREINNEFRLNHPDISPEITLTKIRAIKQHLVQIGTQVDLEVSSVAHAIVYFEKLVIKNVVTKKNRKLIAGCCLFLATKVNEAKGTWFKPLLNLMEDLLGVEAEDIHEHEFSVFADLEFDLFVPTSEFMPHFERILSHLEYKSIQAYLGTSQFYEINQRT